MRAGRMLAAVNPNRRIARKTPLGALKASEGICPPFPRVPRLPPKFAEFGRISGRSPPVWTFPRRAAATAAENATIRPVMTPSFTIDDIREAELAAAASQTPLHKAAALDTAESVKRLLASGADVHAKDNGDATPLHRAAFENTGAVVKVLIANGADVNAEDKNAYTPLHCAAYANAAAVVKVLIANGADVNAKNNQFRRQGGTPLHVAAMRNAAEVVKVLLANGADVNAKEKDTAPHSGYDDRPLHRAAYNRNAAEVAKVLIANGADVNATGKGVWTPLHCAAHSNAAEVAKLLIERGAEIEAAAMIFGGSGPRDISYWTPLLLARRANAAAAEKVLIEHGAGKQRGGWIRCLLNR